MLLKMFYIKYIYVEKISLKIYLFKFIVVSLYIYEITNNKLDSLFLSGE